MDVYLALGSNLGDREGYLRRAVELLRSDRFEVVQVSGVYETAPVGLLDQGWFLNCVLKGQTQLSPLQLLGYCQKVERALRRVRGVVNGPRTMDVDVIFYGRAVIRSRRLAVPHPRYRERRFVLEPLRELDPELRDPETGESLASMLGRVGDQSVRRTGIVAG